MKRVTMADIARELGVHTSTVSMALRKHPRIPISTCERVRETAERMGYRPNPLVSALIAERRKGKVTGKGSTLAFLTATPQKDSWRTLDNYVILYKEIIRQAYLRGYNVEEFWLNNKDVTPGSLRKILLYRGIRGIIVCPLPNVQHSIDFDFSDFTSVALGLTLHSPGLDHVATDYYSVMRMAVERLLETGHKRIGFISSLIFDARVNHLSLGSFLAKRHAEPNLLASPVSVEDWNCPSTKMFVRRWWKEEKTDAIIAPTRKQYEDLHNWLVEDGAKIPRDISLLCLDCLPGTNHSGIAQNLLLQAHAATEKVTSRVERAEFGIPDAPQTVLTSGTFQTGSSFRVRTSS